MVVAERPKIFVSLENIFIFTYSLTIFHFLLKRNIYGKSVTRTFLGAIFERISNGINTLGSGTVVPRCF